MGAKNTLIAGVAALVLMFAAGNAFAQREMPAPLQNAMGQLAAGQVQEALANAEAYLKDNPDDRFTAAALVIAGRCEINLGHSKEAAQRAIDVLVRFGDDNPMAAQAYYLLATALQERGDSYEAARALVSCLDRDPDATVRDLAMKRLTELVEGPVAYRAATLRLLARTEGTRRALDRLLPKSAERPTFGLIVPENKDDNDPGTAVIEGAQAAIEKWSKTQGVNADLVIKRVQPGPARAIEAARNLVRKAGVWGLILGGREPEVLASTVEAQSAGVPVVLPGQRRPGLDAIGPSVVLPEANWRREGRLAAIYAADSLKLRTFAIIAPYTDQGMETVAGFREVLDSLDSVDILAQEWYFPEEDVSLTRQFQRIRTVGFRRAFLDSLVADSVQLDTLLTDSLLGDTLVFDSTRFEMLWQTHLDSVKRSVAYKTGLIDSNAIQLSVFDGLFMPIEPHTIQLFAPQFAFYNFKTTRLGNSAWYEPEELYRHRQYVEDLVFTAPYRLDANGGEMGELQLYLHEQTGGTPGPWQILGYDAVDLLMTPVSKGRVGPWDVSEGLHQIDSLELAEGPQRFEDNSLVGQNMWILTVHDGTVSVDDPVHRRLLLAPPVAVDSTDSTGVVVPTDSLGTSEDAQ